MNVTSRKQYTDEFKSQIVGLAELRMLRRQLADLQLENDILKKAAVILGTKPHPKSGK